MHIVYAGQPTISRLSGAINLPTTRPISEADQSTISKRIRLIHTALDLIFLLPRFDGRCIKLIPAKGTYPKMFSRHVKAILARLEVPPELGFAHDGDAA